MGIIIGADFVPTESNEELFIKADAYQLLGEELNKILKNAEYRIFNLEVPLTIQETPIRKCGPNLIANPKSVNLFKEVGVNLFTVANNHIYDQGKKGFDSTIHVLEENDIAYVGGGENIKEAEKPFIFEYIDKKIGVYACAEHEFSIASETSSGANPINSFESYNHVKKMKEQCDYIIVLYHGGKEHYRYPSPDLQKYCRKFVENGADLVICQHSHCIGCKEEYHNGTIVYGQGNFLFDDCEDECWKTSLLLDVIPGGKIRYIPIVKRKNKVYLANDEESKEILQQFESRSEKIKQKQFVKNKYQEFAESMINDYLWNFSGANRSLLLRTINKISGYKFCKWYVDKKFDRKAVLSLTNYFECEAHRELIIEALKSKIMKW